jgi:hypothetical protein
MAKALRPPEPPAKTRGKKPAPPAAGRPPDYRTVYNVQAYKLALLGATDSELASFFEVSEVTIDNWRVRYPKFAESVKAGRVGADSDVARSLYKRATGACAHREDRVFNEKGVPIIVPTTRHYPPDTTAAVYWLNNRRPGNWKSRQEVDQTVKGEQIIYVTEKPEKPDNAGM